MARWMGDRVRVIGRHINIGSCLPAWGLGGPAWNQPALPSSYRSVWHREQVEEGRPGITSDTWDSRLTDANSLGMARSEMYFPTCFGGPLFATICACKWFFLIVRSVVFCQRLFYSSAISTDSTVTIMGCVGWGWGWIIITVH